MSENMNNESQDKRVFWPILNLFFKWRRLLLINFVVAGLLTLIIMLAFFPNKYIATTILMPPEKESGLGIAGAMLPSGLGSLLSGGGMALPGFASPSDLYASILKSRIVSEAVLKRNNLPEVFKIELEERAIAELQKRTRVAVKPEGMISISYEDTDPERAARVANSFVEELNRVNTENLTSKAGFMRQFIEHRLTACIVDLTAAEEAYRNFQEKNKAISLEDQVKATIGAVAELRGQMVLAEIELGVMKKSLSADNSRYLNQEYKIQQIQKQINILEKGDSTSTSSSLNLPVDATPGLGLELARLTRDLKIQETIFELLKQQYEQAKIQEQRDTPTVQVLDIAKPPHVKSGPKRVSMSLIAGILSFCMTLVFVISIEYYRREKSLNSEAYQKMQSFSQMLNEDLFWLKNLIRMKRN